MNSLGNGVVETRAGLESATVLDAPAIDPTGRMVDEAGALLPLPEARRLANESFERRYLTALLAQAKGDRMRAARLAGVTRQALSQLMQKLGVELPRKNRFIRDV
jgi:DNA-binding NtrC family response regulator